MIPLFMRLAVIDRGTEKNIVNLWLPLFLIWVLLFPVALLGLVAWVVIRAVAIVKPAALLPARIIQAAVTVIWKMNGLRIDVRSRDSRVVLHF
jgi:hypothetical protein